MNILEVATLSNNQIKGAAEYKWNCFGDDSYYLDIGTDEQGQTASCIFDSDNGTVYALELFDAGSRQAWRWIDPRFSDLFFSECYDQDINPDIAFNNVRFTSVSSSEALQILSKLSGQPKPIDDEEDDDDDTT